MTSERYISYRHFLTDELKTRQERNRDYSMRDFANELNIRSSRLTEILNGKVGLSEDRALRVAESLKISEDEKKIFVDLVQSVHGRGTVTKKLASERLRLRFPEASQMQMDQFDSISEWYHLAIVDLIKTKGFENNPAFISRKLGISEADASMAIERLVRIGALEQVDGQLRQSTENRTTTREVPSMAIRTFHRQILQKAETALDNQELNERDFGSLVFSISKEQLPLFKEKILQLRREFKNEIASRGSDEKNAVYCFSSQLFQLTERI